MLRCRERSDVPLAPNARQQTACLFDHFVSSGKQRWRYRQAERFGSLEIYR